MSWMPLREQDSIPSWEPIPLELPLDDPYQRRPTPAGGEPRPGEDDDGEPRRRVIIIDLKRPHGLPFLSPDPRLRMVSCAGKGVALA